MDILQMFPQKIREEHKKLTDLFFSRSQEEDWGGFCKEFASEEYIKAWSDYDRYVQEEYKKGIIIN